MKALRRARIVLMAGGAFVLAGCFASVGQLEQLRSDVSAQRAEADANDSIRAVQLVQILATLRNVTDSIAGFSTRLNRMRAESQSDMRALRQDVAAVQATTGQSQERLQQLRAQIEQRNRESTPAAPAPVPPAPAAQSTSSSPPVTDGAQPLSASPAATPPDTATSAPVISASETPGPNELFQIGKDQLTRGGNKAARAAFTDLLKRFPDSELAADAQFYIAESYAAEGANLRADTAYAAVVTRYGTSPRAPTALYKRGFLAQKGRRLTTARRLYNELISRYPDSDEAELARERLRVLG
jgi:tol-pal system protein YbgF